MSRTLKAHLSVFVVNLIYGANFSIAKGVMPRYLEPLGFVTVRVLVSFALFYIIHRFFIKESPEKKDIPRLALCGVFGVAINQMLFFKGLSLTTPINGAIIMTTNPIMVLIIAAFLIREKITMRKVAGITAGLSGALLLILTGKNLSFGENTVLGDFAIFLNAISWGIFLVIAKPLMKKYNPITIITWAFFFGTMLVIPFGYEEFTRISWETMPGKVWLAVAYVVLAVTFIAYLLNTIALNTLSPSVVSFYIYLQPLFATLIALASGHDTLNAVKITSSVLIFLGVYLISLPPKEKVL
jgi:drug/metabolite transporter (DMT)-like permease